MNHDAPVKRYRTINIFVNGRTWEPRTIESPNGEYVLAADHDRVVEELCGQVEQANQQLDAVGREVEIAGIPSDDDEGNTFTLAERVEQIANEANEAEADRDHLRERCAWLERCLKALYDDTGMTDEDRKAFFEFVAAEPKAST